MAVLSASLSSKLSKYVCAGRRDGWMLFPYFALIVRSRETQSAVTMEMGSPCALCTASIWTFVSRWTLAVFYTITNLPSSLLCLKPKFGSTLKASLHVSQNPSSVLSKATKSCRLVIS